MEGNGGGAMDDAARDENEHAAWTFYRALERGTADACGTTDPARVFAGSKGLGHVQATKGFNSGHLFFSRRAWRSVQVPRCTYTLTI